MITLKDIKENIYIPCITNASYDRFEMDEENAKEFLKQCIENAKSKMKELYPEIKFKFTLLYQNYLKQFIIIGMFYVEGEINYLCQAQSLRISCKELGIEKLI